MHSKSDKGETIFNDKTDEVIEELSKWLKTRYQNNLEFMRGSSGFVFDYTHLLYYKCNETNPYRSKSYIDSSKRIKNKKKTAVNVTVILNHKEIGKHPERMAKVEPLSKYNWERINFPSKKRRLEKIWEKECKNCSEPYSG